MTLVGALLLVSSINPIVRLFLLVVIYTQASFQFISQNFPFIGLTYLIVYVGAISILFLFVIMMLEQTNQNQSIQGVILPITTQLVLLYLLEKTEDVYTIFNIQWINKIGLLTDIQNLGLFFYQEFGIALVFIGLFLWMIMIGVIAVCFI